MKKNILATIIMAGLLAMVTMFSACNSSGDGPTTPTLPNAFKITDGQYKVTIGGNFNALDIWFSGSYTNNTSSYASIKGTVNWGDGKNSSINGDALIPKGPSASGQWSARTNHDYDSRGTYTVEVTLNANFDNGVITETWKKDIVVN